MSKTILVTGDPICDHNYYKGERPTATSDNPRGFRDAQEGGGALLLKKLIVATMGKEADCTTKFGLDERYRSLPLAYHSFCLWEPQIGNPEADSREQIHYWRTVEPPMGYGPKGKISQADKAYSPNPIPCTETPEVVVVDDAGLGFRKHKELWSCMEPAGANSCPRWVVLKLTGAIGKSLLWDCVAEHCKSNLVVIVPAEELRRHDVRLSRGLSWEATAMDLVAELDNNPLLKPLKVAHHLIVTFQSDGAYWRNNDPRGASSLLVFDASHAEGEWSESQGKGGAFGYLSCFTAAIVRELCRTKSKDIPDLETACGAGLSASRELRRRGHGQVVVGEKEPRPGFPFREVAARIRDYDPMTSTPKFVSAVIPQDQRDRNDWMMLDEWQVQAQANAKRQPYYGAALAVAVLGPEALERFPVARFGNYQTVDRKEIESLRTIRQLIANYMKQDRPKTPLNLGVFGPPGSGKSFIVIEIAKEVLQLREEDVLLFNLSQFSEPSDLLAAFHQVRDKVLRGETTVAFWDEFDSQKYRWLQYLLAPMEDGFFQEGQIKHPIGKCVFFFAGATSATYEQFGPMPVSREQVAEIKDGAQLREMEAARKDFVLAKGPDFKSRLVGYLNILGVNPRPLCREEGGRRYWDDDPTDLCYPIRRALFIRGLFKAKPGKRLKIDQGVLRAMLEIPKYKSGGRSLQFLCSHLRQNSSGAPGRANLPGYELLNMHVEAKDFWKLCEQEQALVGMSLKLAAALHEGYRLQIKGKPEKADLDKPLSDIPPDKQSANIAQALRIPDILRLVGLQLVPGEVVDIGELPDYRPDEEELRKIIEVNLDLMAEAEHNGWMVERMLAGLRYARVPDLDRKKFHNLLIPYNQLSKDDKDYDRHTINGDDTANGTKRLGYVDLVKIAGFRIAVAPTPESKKS